MFKRNTRLLAILAAAAAMLVSCKDDEEDTVVLPSLSGQVRFYVDLFVEKNATVTITPSGAIHPEGNGIGYYWTISPPLEDSDEDTQTDTTRLETDPATVTGAITYTFPDKIGSYTVGCTAFASGYYSLSTSTVITVVDPEESLTGMDTGFSGTYGTYTDGRDGKRYRTVEIGNREWFAENLKYAGDGNTGIPYANAEAMSDVFGKYYTWDEAMSACPESDGWRVPDEEDWTVLARELSGDGSLEAFGRFGGIAGKMMVDASFNSEENYLWEFWPEVNITNESGLAVIPCGFANLSEDMNGESFGTFESMPEYAAFWTGETYEKDPEQACYRYIFSQAPDLCISAAQKRGSFAATVRCVRDAE